MKKKILAILTVGLLLAALAACGRNQGNAEVEPNNSKKIPNVSVAPVELREMVEKIILPGLVHPEKEVIISAEVGGIIEKIGPEKADRIRKGEVLAEIDRETLKANFDRTEAALSQARLAEKEAHLGIRAAMTRLENAESQVEQARLGLEQAERVYEKTHINYKNQEKRFERIKKLFDEDLASQSAYDDAQSLMKSLEADYESAHSGVDNAREAIQIAEGGVTSAKIDLESARLKIETVGAEIRAQEAALTQARLSYEKGLIAAPFDAYVDDIYREEGEFIPREAYLMKLIKPDPVEVRVSLPEKDVPFLREGQKGEITINSLPGDKFTGKVSFVALSSDTRTNTYPVEITVPNPSGRIKAGMIAQVTLVRRKIPNAVSVPSFTVMQKEDGEVVFVLEDGRAVRRLVQTGILENGRVQITEGLSPGEKLIIKGQRDLEDGEEVKVL
jgi:RND family efflux transporter MFP subunit